MIYFPEHDPHLIVNKRTAERFLEMIAPSPDDPQHPMPGEHADDRPQVHSVHTFVIRDDTGTRLHDSMLNKVLTGTLDGCFDELVQMNTHRRVGIFVRLDPAYCIVAEAIDMAEADTMHDWLPRRTFRIEPSLTIDCGVDGTAYRRPLKTWAWLLDKDVQTDDGASFTNELASIGVRAKADALVRVPGFYIRRNAPTMVMAHGLRETIGTKTVRYQASHVRPVLDTVGA